jgi:hypothetical protein
LGKVRAWNMRDRREVVCPSSADRGKLSPVGERNGKGNFAAYERREIQNVGAKLLLLTFFLSSKSGFMYFFCENFSV